MQLIACSHLVTSFIISACLLTNGNHVLTF